MTLHSLWKHNFESIVFCQSHLGNLNSDVKMYILLCNVLRTNEIVTATSSVIHRDIFIKHIKYMRRTCWIHSRTRNSMETRFRKFGAKVNIKIVVNSRLTSASASTIAELWKDIRILHTEKILCIEYAVNQFFFALFHFCVLYTCSALGISVSGFLSS